MKTFFKYLRSGFILTVLMLVLCGLAYPAAMTGMGQAFFSHQANGSLVTASAEEADGAKEAVGSEIAGQDFKGEEGYFVGRVSSVNYNTYTKEQLENGEYGGVSSGSFNYGASNEDLKKRVEADIDEFLKNNPEIKREEIPASLVTASGSGLDPDITVKAAKIQVPAMSKINGLSEEELYEIIEHNTSGKILGIFGHERVNVLKCNLEIAQKIKEM